MSAELELLESLSELARTTRGEVSMRGREFSNAFERYREGVQRDAMEYAKANYVPPVAKRNIVHAWSVSGNSRVIVRCDDNTMWYCSQDDTKWTQIPSIPGTVPE